MENYPTAEETRRNSEILNNHRAKSELNGIISLIQKSNQRSICVYIYYDTNVKELRKLGYIVANDFGFGLFRSFLSLGIGSCACYYISW